MIGWLLLFYWGGAAIFLFLLAFRIRRWDPAFFGLICLLFFVRRLAKML